MDLFELKIVLILFFVFFVFLFEVDITLSISAIMNIVSSAGMDVAHFFVFFFFALLFVNT